MGRSEVKAGDLRTNYVATQRQENEFHSGSQAASRIFLFERLQVQGLYYQVLSSGLNESDLE